MLGYELVEIEELSGSKATIYSVLLDGDDLTLFDHFVEEYGISHKAAIKDLIARLQVIGSMTGAREQFFKHFEGRPGDGVCALCDSDNRELRLFCVRYGNVAIILGGGGVKDVRAWQDDPKLSKEAHRMIEVSDEILAKLQSGAIWWSADGTQLEGELYINRNDKKI